MSELLHRAHEDTADTSVPLKEGGDLEAEPSRAGNAMTDSLGGGERGRGGKEDT